MSDGQGRTHSVGDRAHVLRRALPAARAAHFERERNGATGATDRADEARHIELASTWGDTVLEAIHVVIEVLRLARAVAHLDSGDHRRRERGDRGEVVRTPHVMPDVDADPAVRPVGGLHDRTCVVHGDDVGERQELEADDEPMVGGAVAQRAERPRSVDRRQRRRSDHLHVPAAEFVGHPERGLFHLRGPITARSVAPETGDDLDLGEADTVLGEQLAQSARSTSLVLEMLVLADEKPDSGEAVVAGEADAILDRELSRQAEVTQHQFVGAHLARIMLVHALSLTQRGGCFGTHRGGSQMAGRLDGKVALVTGGASGIGEATVRRFVAEGARVVIADMQREPGQALAEELGTATRFALTNVTAEDDIAAAVALTMHEFGRLDVMFNNAGIVGAIGRIADTPVEDWDRTVAVLMRGVFLGIKHAARVMVPQGSGSIISTSSTAGILGGLGPHCYTACKHAVIGLTKSAASELGSSGVRVNAISPGSTVSPMTSAVITGDHTAIEATTKQIAATSLLGFAPIPADIANAALYLASDESRAVTGHTLVVDVGATTIGGSTRFHHQANALLSEAGQRVLSEPRV